MLYRNFFPFSGKYGGFSVGTVFCEDPDDWDNGDKTFTYKGSKIIAEYFKYAWHLPFLKFCSRNKWLWRCLLMKISLLGRKWTWLLARPLSLNLMLNIFYFLILVHSLRMFMACWKIIFIFLSFSIVTFRMCDTPKCLRHCD